jgi:alkanesulfonate monooxygenase SsuD/methylene tetrahydromethanopterin reductase-like flavin-dependent oxidoreductase (luciferase family)
MVPAVRIARANRKGARYCGRNQAAMELLRSIDVACFAFAPCVTGEHRKQRSLFANGSCEARTPWGAGRRLDCYLRHGHQRAAALHMDFGRRRRADLNLEEARREGRTNPELFRQCMGRLLKRVKSFSLPEEARFRQIHDGHCTYLQPGERRFVTPEAIRASCVIGTPEEIVEQLRALEKGGTKELNLLPAADYQKNVWRDFAEMVIPVKLELQRCAA